MRLLAIAGVVIVLAGLVTVGFVIGAAVLAVTALVLVVRRWLSWRAPRSADPAVIEGEFTVVSPRPRAELPRPE